MATEFIIGNRAAQGALHKGFGTIVTVCKRLQPCTVRNKCYRDSCCRLILCAAVGNEHSERREKGVDGSMVSLQDNPTQGASKTEAPLISTIIPLFNCEKYLGAAIESILAQNYQPMQIIVVDDGSTDGSAAVARSFSQVEYYFQENAGVATALNHGLSKAKGEFIAFLDSDDLWMEGQTQAGTRRLCP